MNIGDVAGTLVVTKKEKPNWVVHCCSTKLRVHRVVWEMHNGNIPKGLVIDHIDGDPSNNKIENLRLATSSQNSCNQKCQKNKKSGLPKGISPDGEGRIRATVRFKGKSYSLRTTEDDQEFSELWLSEMRDLLHGDFANNGGV